MSEGLGQMTPGLSISLAEARKAQAKWAALPLSERLAFVRRVRNLLPSHAEGLAQSSSREKLETFSSELLPLAAACRFLEREANGILGARKEGWVFRPMWLAGVDHRIVREPYGIVLVIAPRNYPILLPGVQVLQALTAGNAVMLKPGVAATSSASALLKLFLAAKMDPALVTLLPESVEASVAALQSGVDKVFFTGGAKTGQKVLEILAPQLIPATVELSGCDSVFIRDDADLELVAQALHWGLQLNHSETCIAPRRVFVPKKLAPLLEAKLLAGIGQWPQKALDSSTETRLEEHLGAAIGAGARLISGTLPTTSGRAPWILADAHPSMQILQEDFFAPVLSLVPVGSDEEALTFANCCPFALGASIFTKNEPAAMALAVRIDTGSVTINDLIAPTADPRVPFGGLKRSGFGTTRGPEGLLEMTRAKVISIRRGPWHLHFKLTRPEDKELLAQYLTAVNSSHLATRVQAFVKLVGLAIKRVRS